MKIFIRFLKNLGIWVVVIIILACINRWYLGGFKKIVILEQNIPAYTIAYLPFTGDNKEGDSMMKVYTILSGVGIFSVTGVRIYYNNAELISGMYFRSKVGAVITAEDVKKLAHHPEMNIITIPEGTKIITEFPLKTSTSLLAWSIKIYPMLVKYLTIKGYDNKVPIIELYDTIAKKIYYMVEVTK